MDIKKYIQESNAIEDIYSLEEIQQSLVAWRYLNRLNEITHYNICRLQKIITLNQIDLRPNERGYYRSFSKINVTVGSKRLPSYKNVDKLMEEWLKDLPKMSPVIAHIRFETIHPFVDGNGRVGRMIYWWHCKLMGIKPALYLAKHRDRYYRLFTPKRVKELKNNHWGIDFLTKYSYEVAIKTDKGIKKCGFFKEPTTEEIKESLPKEEHLLQVIYIKQLK